jgi:hypothetical protein
MNTATVPKKHGLHIREHKKWNTKTIYNDGHVLRVYRRQPKTIRFQSPMVNDINQHLCGGWHVKALGDVNEAIVRQLLTGSKPFGVMNYWPNRHSEAVEAQKSLDSAGLVTDMRKREFKSWKYDHIWDLQACHDIRVQDIGDLRALEADYAGALDTSSIIDFQVSIGDVGDLKLSVLFDGWDSPPLPLWLTGLILGYPIENTISLYRE